MKRFFFYKCLTGFMILFFFAAAIPADAEEGEPIKVGVLAVFTGPAAPWGLAVLHTTEMWADEVNSMGGLNVNGVKHKIQIIKEDTKYDPVLAASGAEKLINREGVKFIHGLVGSQMAPPVAGIATQNKVIVMQYTWQKKYATTQYPYHLESMASSRIYSKAMFKYLRETYPDKKKVAIMAPMVEGAHELMASTADAAKRYGFEVVGDPIFYEYSTQDYYPLVTKALANKPDILCLGWTAAGLAAVQIKTARELGFEGLTFQLTQGDLETTLSIAGKAAEGHLYLGGGADDVVATEKMKKYKAEYIKRYGRWNEGAAQELYTPMILGMAIERAGTYTDTDKIIKTMSEISFNTDYVKGNPRVYYTQEEGTDRKATLIPPMTFVQIKDGKEGTVTILKEIR